MPRLKICLSPKLPNAPLVPESANLLVTVGGGAGAAGAAYQSRKKSFQGVFESASTWSGAPSATAECALFVHRIGLTADRKQQRILGRIDGIDPTLQFDRDRHVLLGGVGGDR